MCSFGLLATFINSANQGTSVVSGSQSRTILLQLLTLMLLPLLHVSKNSYFEFGVSTSWVTWDCPQTARSLRILTHTKSHDTQG